jgi:Cys-rich protein (TIGR01571 family)
MAMATSSLASLIKAHEAVELPQPSKTEVHQRSPSQALNLLTSQKLPDKLPPPSSTTVHQKVAGNGYKKGSPLYNLQEGKQDAAKLAPKAAEPQNATRQEKLYACVDHELAKSEDTPAQEIIDGVNDCIVKHDATPLEAWGIRERVYENLYARHFWTSLVSSILIFLIIPLIVAFVYQRNKKDPEPVRRGMGMSRDDFQYGICSCFEVPAMSLLTCCCFAVRWADTMRMASYLSFWVGVVMILFLELINAFTGGLALCVAWGIVVYYRQQLRKEFGLESGTLKSCCCDICGYFWIPCCMAVQEARQLEEAYAVGHPVRKVP